MKNDDFNPNPQNNNINVNEETKKQNASGDKKSFKKPLIASSILGVAAAGIVGGILGSNALNNNTTPPPPYVNFIDFTKNDNGVYSAEVANTIENLDFSKCIEVSENCTWSLYSDAEATQPLDILVALTQGYNIFYVKVSDEYGNFKIYPLQVRRQNESFLVTFNTHGGTIIETQSIEKGTLVKKPQDPVKEGYEFTGWNFDFDTPVTEDVTITANYNLIDYEITYELDGGTNNAGNHKIYTIKDAFNLQDAIKTGYVFKGWFIDSEFNEQITEIEQGTTGNKTVYAKWELETYTIIYNLDNGINDINNPTTYTIETETITLQNPTREGYRFMGWYTDASFTNVLTEIPNGCYNDVTLYAKWTEIDYASTIFNFSEDGKISGLTDSGKTLETLNIPSTINGIKITSIEASAFTDSSNLKTLTIAEGVNSIGSSAFSKCKSLTSVTLPDSLTNIESGAFNSCTALTSIDIPKNTTTIGYVAFAGCSSLREVIIPESITSIGYSAFCWCTNLVSITIPKSVTTIPNSILMGCSNLSSLSILGEVTSIGNDAFNGCSKLTGITLPETVTSIGDDAFYGCSGLTSISIPKGVTSIGSGAFQDCIKIKSISIPKGVTTLENALFYGCTELTSVTIPEGVTSISATVFRNCSSLTRIVIPEGVTSIGMGSFNGCLSLTYVTLPKSLKNIDSYAFENCSKISRVYYRGSSSDWGKINIGVENTYLTGANKTYNYTN